MVSLSPVSRRAGTAVESLSLLGLRHFYCDASLDTSDPVSARSDFTIVTHSAIAIVAYNALLESLLCHLEVSYGHTWCFITLATVMNLYR